MVRFGIWHWTKSKRVSWLWPSGLPSSISWLVFLWRGLWQQQFQIVRSWACGCRPSKDAIFYHLFGWGLLVHHWGDEMIWEEQKKLAKQAFPHCDCECLWVWRHPGLEPMFGWSYSERIIRKLPRHVVCPSRFPAQVEDFKTLCTRLSCNPIWEHH